MTSPPSTLSTLRRITVAVVLLVAVSVTAIVWMVVHAGREQNRLAEASASQQFEGLMRLQAETLVRQTQDYAHWDDAIRYLLTDPDPAWWSGNSGEYAIDTFDLAFAMAVSSRGEALFQATASDGVLDIQSLLDQPAMQALMRQSREQPEASPAGNRGVSGLVRAGDAIYLVTAAPFLEESDDSPRNPDPGALLLFARSFSGALLTETAEIMGVQDMQWQADRLEDGRFQQALMLADGTPGGAVLWRPAMPGRDLLSSLWPGLLAVFALMLIALAEAARRTTQLTRRLMSDAARAQGQTQQIEEAHERLRQLHGQLQERVEHTEARNRSLEDLALRDSLTQLGNRRSLQLAAERLGPGVGPRGAFAVLMLDVDHFKAVNDRYGHDHGDAVLMDVAQCLQRVARQQDEAIRYGGEEFVLILPQTRLEHALRVAERIHREVALRKPAGLAITISVGVAATDDGLDDLFKVLKDADDALYAAKRQGRNQTVVANGWAGRDH